ncbi:hypothetical protein COCNU_14G003700 [Cocos nucifera]|uniref:Uncharacterized protein n=1 Tax=Cocos nucifera TaxID=13894 RepID=A0A8K0NC70_COCNU|nr:hypothetical protein COCNU_14G003700 [Cocos nucifera]
MLKESSTSAGIEVAQVGGAIGEGSVLGRSAFKRAGSIAKRVGSAIGMADFAVSRDSRVVSISTVARSGNKTGSSSTTTARSGNRTDSSSTAIVGRTERTTGGIARRAERIGSTAAMRGASSSSARVGSTTGWATVGMAGFAVSRDSRADSMVIDGITRRAGRTGSTAATRGASSSSIKIGSTTGRATIRSGRDRFMPHRRAMRGRSETL